MAAPAVTFQKGALDDLLAGPAGPVAKDLLRRAMRVESMAKRLCPVDTGRLRSSITTEIARSSGGIMVARVGTNVEYARMVHDGTRGHVIRARRAKVLRFAGSGGRIVYRRQVWHPGTRGKPFLRDALPAAAG